MNIFEENPGRVLIIIRHAHRFKKPLVDVDNGLSPKGKKQSRFISKFLSKLHCEEETHLYSSPKKRCIETLTPFAKKKKLSIQNLRSLNEDFLLHTSIADFMEWWRKESETAKVTIVCTHLNWIESFFSENFSLPFELKKGGVAILFGDRKLKIFEIRQSLE
ncbi:MAG: histidine phosphatase family protein [Gammaproteobacteria bacterium]|nr:histidine phosphatase family protein [Gammaproteobacteria bacterium]